MSDVQSQRKMLCAPIGLPGSGGMRYGAAMFFYARGEIPPQMLEIYRMCSKFDNEDPVKIARFEGVALPPITDAP